MKYIKNYAIDLNLLISYHILKNTFEIYHNSYSDEITKSFEYLLEKLRLYVEPNDEYNSIDIEDFKYILKNIYNKEQVKSKFAKKN